MRGDDEICGSLFSYIDLEDRVRADHPLRPIREIANAALATQSRNNSIVSGCSRLNAQVLKDRTMSSGVAIRLSGECAINGPGRV